MSTFTVWLTIRQILIDSHDSLRNRSCVSAMHASVSSVCMSDKCCKEPMGAIYNSTLGYTSDGYGLSYGTYGQNRDMVPIFESGAGEHHIHPSIYLNRLGVRTPGLGTSIRVSSAVCRREDSPERLSLELIQPDPRPPPRSVKLGVF